MPVDIDLDKLGRSQFMAGAVGALITALRFTPGASWWERLLNTGSGLAMAIYLTPMVAEWWNITSQKYISGVAFAIGMLGVTILAAGLKAIKELPAAQIISGWISKKG